LGVFFRAVVLVLALSALLPGRALAADVVTLHVGPNPVRYGAPLLLDGTIEPAVANETVGIYARSGRALSRVASATTDGLGTFSLALVAKKHIVLVAQGEDEFGNPVASQPASVRLEPRVAVSLEGSRRIGARLVLVGRVRPRTAGSVTVTDGVMERRIRPGPGGRFHADLTTTRAFRYRVGVRLHPAFGYVGWHASRSVRVKVPLLSSGARGPAVRWLQQTLAGDDGYALPGISSIFDAATVDAVLAFQRVHGLPMTGVVDRRLWELIGTSGRPRARIPFGDHIEVDKSRQLLFEVRAGTVVSVTRVSTGATGNTPVGHWHVYGKSPGFNAKGMYDSLFFLRGFAIHGYVSVPTYPASHGCVRTPLWFAPGIYSRWGVGSSVYVFA
jgi:Putative peptidoglycan binding domain/L,D-transpeptidase catalytic domain